MTMDNRTPEEILKELSDDLSVLEQTDKRDLLATYINNLLLNDFNALVYLLYRVDVDEARLKLILAENREYDAAYIITEVLLERMKEKEASRRSFNSNEDIPEDEKW